MAPGKQKGDYFLHQLDWNLLKTFSIVAEAGSLTKAAQRLGHFHVQRVPRAIGDETARQEQAAQGQIADQVEDLVPGRLVGPAEFVVDQSTRAEHQQFARCEVTADPLLLRYALAARAARAGDGAAALQRLAGRFAASRARGDRVHLREEAIFALRAGDDPEGALALARENWKTQKEPLDARIALEAALAAGDAASVRDVVAWVARTGLEDQRIAHLAARLGSR